MWGRGYIFGGYRWGRGFGGFGWGRGFGGGMPFGYGMPFRYGYYGYWVNESTALLNPTFQKVG